MEDAEREGEGCAPADARLRELQLQREGRHRVHRTGGVCREDEEGPRDVLRLQEGAGDRRILTDWNKQAAISKAVDEGQRHQESRPFG